MLTAQEANHILGCIKKKKKKKDRQAREEVTSPFYPALGKLYLEYCIQAWSPQNKKGMELLGRVQGAEKTLSAGVVQSGEGSGETFRQPFDT